MHNQLYNNDSYKVKTPKGVICTGACLCLGRKVRFLSFMNVDPKSSDLSLLDRRHSQHLEQNAMLNLTSE
jgi:hypothetical protein